MSGIVNVHLTHIDICKIISDHLRVVNKIEVPSVYKDYIHDPSDSFNFSLKLGGQTYHDIKDLGVVVTAKI